MVSCWWALKRWPGEERVGLATVAAVGPAAGDRGHQLVGGFPDGACLLSWMTVAGVATAAVGYEIGHDGWELAGLAVARRRWIAEWARSSRTSRPSLTDTGAAGAAAGTVDWGKMTAVAAAEDDDGVAVVVVMMVAVACEDDAAVAMVIADEIYLMGAFAVVVVVMMTTTDDVK